MSLKEGDIAPNFTLQDENENTFSLSDYKGKKIVLYFYPKDNTSGCTKEACAFVITSYSIHYTKLYEKIFPSPIFPVNVASLIALTVRSTLSSLTTISTLTLGRKSTAYSAPR